PDGIDRLAAHRGDRAVARRGRIGLRTGHERAGAAGGGGALFLVPNLLGAVSPQDALPQRTLDVARSLTHWIVETPKPARAFLKSLGVAVPIAALEVQPLPDPAAT